METPDMEIANASKIIQALANGTDPVSGEVFPESSTYNHPTVIRALFVSLKSLEELELKEKRARRLPANSGKPWGAEEDRNLCEEFDRGVPVKELASKYLRTDGAIEARLVRLGKISARVDAFGRSGPGT
jgi:hypothetical protein